MPETMNSDNFTSLLSRRSLLARIGTIAVSGTIVPLNLQTLTTHSPQNRDEDFERVLRLASVPSLSYAIVDADKITTRSVGVRKAGESERATPDTVYAAASLTKAVFSYVFLGLVNEGLLSLDKPVHEYLPLPNPEDARSNTITARHLLSHSGGWRNWRNNTSTVLTADFEPGSRWSYSGEGFFFLQRIVEKLTGKSVPFLARERVFDPLGMKRSSFVGLAELEPFQATGHSGRGDVTQPFGRPTLLELRRMMSAKGVSLEAAKVEDAEQAIKTAEPMLPVLPNFLSPNAAASMLTTANDFALFLKHLVTARRAGGAPAAIVELMLTPQVKCNEAVQWGLGVGLEDLGSRRFAWQWGDNPGFKNIFFADPRDMKAIAVFTNGDRGARVYERVIRALTGEDHPAFLWA
ncbi:MAG TPA: serine hydrolase [Gemmatimonadaceae bacterium]|jgi:CubicO group peptidase (beta-lactamase class C family)